MAVWRCYRGRPHCEDVLQELREKKTIDDEVKGALERALNEFGQQFAGSAAAVA